MKKNQKVFGIGFHKTGTSSLGEALRQLGYSPIANYTPELLPHIKSSNWQAIQNFCQSYQAFEDNPWPLLYRELDEMFPDSKFVLTIRPHDQWLNSVIKHFSDSNTEMREWIYGKGYGTPNEDIKQIYIDRYNNHNKEVLSYFDNRPDDLAVLDWSQGSGWPELCRVLNCSVPKRPFPHTNQAKQRNILGRFEVKLRSLIST